MRRMCGVLAATCSVALACTPPRRPPPPGPVPLVVKKYEPLAFASDALAAGQSVLLATDASGGSTILPLAAASATLVVDAATPASLARVSLSAAPNADGAVHVSLTGDGSAPWHAGAWQAAIVAASTLDKDLVDLAFSVDAPAALDGGNSALIATALVAARTGARVDTTSTVLGVIDPDGTIAPVGQLAARVRAAIAGGKHTIGIPPVTHQEIGATTAKLVEVEDIADAYQVLTGAHLPRTLPLAEAAMALSPSRNQALEVAYKQRQQQVAAEWAGILQLDSAGRMPVLLTFARDRAQALVQSAEHLRKQGQLGAAYARLVGASNYAAAANTTYDVLGKVQAGRIDAAIALLTTRAPPADQAGTLFGSLGTQHPVTLDDHLRLLAAFRGNLESTVLASFAGPALATARAQLKLLVGKRSSELGSAETANLVTNATLPALLYVGDSAAAAERARDAAAGETTAAASTIALPRIEPLIAAYRSAAAVALARIDVLRTEARVSPLAYDPVYVTASGAVRLQDPGSVVSRLAAGWGAGSFSSTMLEFASSDLALSSASEVLSLLHAEHLDHDHALAALVVAAERTARSYAHAAQIASGSIPEQARLAYQDARAASRNAAERVDALAGFWTASAYCRLAVQLARH